MMHYTVVFSVSKANDVGQCVDRLSQTDNTDCVDICKRPFQLFKPSFLKYLNFLKTGCAVLLSLDEPVGKSRWKLFNNIYYEMRMAIGMIKHALLIKAVSPASRTCGWYMHQILVIKMHSSSSKSSNDQLGRAIFVCSIVRSSLVQLLSGGGLSVVVLLSFCSAWVSSGFSCNTRKDV